jgi:hypothetical protein
MIFFHAESYFLFFEAFFFFKASCIFVLMAY